MFSSHPRGHSGSYDGRSSSGPAVDLVGRGSHELHLSHLVGMHLKPVWTAQSQRLPLSNSPGFGLKLVVRVQLTASHFLKATRSREYLYNAHALLQASLFRLIRVIGHMQAWADRVSVCQCCLPPQTIEAAVYRMRFVTSRTGENSKRPYRIWLRRASSTQRTF